MGSRSEWGHRQNAHGKEGRDHTGRKESLCLTKSFRTTDTTGFRLVKLSCLACVSSLHQTPAKEGVKTVGTCRNH